MKYRKKEIKVSFAKNTVNYSNIKELYCDCKSIFNYVMLVLSSLFALVCGYYMIRLFYYDLIDNRLNINFLYIVSIMVVLFLIITPTIYFLLKIINFHFYINEEKVIYKNVVGKSFSYLLNEITSANFYASIGEETIDSIVIKFIDKRKVKVSSTDRNFKLLKSFLINKNLLTR